MSQKAMNQKSASSRIVKNHSVRHGSHRVLLALMLVAGLLANPLQLVLASTPVSKSDSTQRKALSRAPFKRTSKAELVGPLKTRDLKFSQSPTDEEIYKARVFSEPLVPMNTNMLPAENQALAKSLLSFAAKKGQEDFSDLNSFLASHPQSRWKASLEANLAQKLFESGFISEALKLWLSSWEAAKTQTGRAGKAVADQALSSLLIMEGRLGRMSDLKTHLADASKRDLNGSAAEKAKAASDGLWAMENRPETAFQCGPYAVSNLASLILKKDPMSSEQLLPSSKKGTNLVQLKDFAAKSGLKLQMARRSPGAKLILPAIMHWKVGHFAAITSFAEGRYRLKDPTFGESGILALSQKAIDSQSDGYFLVPEGKLEKGWKAVANTEGETVWGKGNAQSRDNNKTPQCPRQNPSGGCPKGMAVASAFSMNASLSISDEPLTYSPPIGPEMSFVTTYNYNQGQQPATFTFTNLGPDWNINWLSYMTIDVSNKITLRVRGGGYEIYNYPYTPDVISKLEWCPWVAAATNAFFRTAALRILRSQTAPIYI